LTEKKLGDVGAQREQSRRKSLKKTFQKAGVSYSSAQNATTKVSAI
jgi:hypothetical protein